MYICCLGLWKKTKTYTFNTFNKHTTHFYAPEQSEQTLAFRVVSVFGKCRLMGTFKVVGVESFRDVVEVST